MDLKPSTYHHTPLVKLFNAVSRTLNRIGLAKIDLSEEALFSAARRATGLVHFGDESFLPGLRAFLQSITEQSQLNPYGRLSAWQCMLGPLKNRLWANACFEAHPEIVRRKIVAPIVVAGPGRSGTTRMQRMLACDSRLQYLRHWEGVNPAPRIGQPEWGGSARYRELKRAFWLARYLYAGVGGAHPMDPDWAEEETLLLNHTFCSTLMFAFNVPGYYQWFLQHDKTSNYRDMANLMRLLSWSREDPEDKRWVLKSPQHMLDLDVLVQTFPDAKLVFIHRDPVKTAPSLMSLMWHSSVQCTDVPCRAAVRDMCMDFSERAARRCIALRETLPKSQQLDVYYEDINRDWRAVMRRVYDFSGIEFTPKAQEAMDAWWTHSQRENRHGAHRYSSEDFGLTKQDVDARMMFLRERYAIPYEGH